LRRGHRHRRHPRARRLQGRAAHRAPRRHMNGPSDKATDEAGAPQAGRAMSYAEYLRLDRILDAPTTLSPDRNELLFIIQHQTSELWMKLMLHELTGAIEGLRADELPPVFKMLARVSRIMEQLVQAWNVLATMTPSEYTALRPYLGTSSGFQS